MKRSYSDHYFGGDKVDPARNVAVDCFQFDSTRFVVTYVLILLVVYGAIHGSGYSTAESLSAANCAHAFITFFFFHWAKGSPDTHAQGAWNGLTVWEQLDDASVFESPTKKIFLAVPMFMLLAQLNAAGFAKHDIAVNLPVYALFCVLPKLPLLHGVRLFGINRTVGIDDVVDAKKA